MPGGSVRESFEVETWAIGQMLLLPFSMVTSRMERSFLLEVIDPDAQRGFLDSVVEGDLNSIGLLVDSIHRIWIPYWHNRTKKSCCRGLG